ncbi:MAG: cyclic nucleotide-binding domain-containing protein [Gammaproteobacteria bacterium]|nr:cyclic nucleotide-binding domain-containing protein [Gammaproteobacteria bacterium]
MQIDKEMDHLEKGDMTLASSQASDSARLDECIRQIPALGPLDEHQMQTLSSTARKQFVPKGSSQVIAPICRGDATFLLTGALSTRDDSGNCAEIIHGQPTSHGAIGGGFDGNPFEITAQIDSEIVTLDLDILNVLSVWSFVHAERPDYTVDAANWLPQLASSELFSTIPPTGLHKLFQTLQCIPIPGGELIVEQGEPATDFFIVMSGKAESWRDDDPPEPLSPGDSFGEEALVASTTRSASVRMTEAGTLLRLDREAFEALLKSELDLISRQGAESLIEQGAVWLDVRANSAAAKRERPQCIAIPLQLLEQRVGELTLGQPYIVCCDGGSRSAAAGAWLSEQGHAVVVLNPSDVAMASANILAGGADLHAELAKADAALEAALRAKVEATAERRIWTTETREIEATDLSAKDKQRLRSSLKKLELESGNAGRLLADAQRRKFELESDLRTEEARAESVRQKAEQACEEIRLDAQGRIEAEKTAAGESARIAKDALVSLQKSRAEICAALERERAQLEARYQQKIDTVDTQIAEQESRTAEDSWEARVQAITLEQARLEKSVRDDAEHQLRTDKEQLAERFAVAIREIETAKSTLDALQQRRKETEAQARRIAAQLRAAAKQKCQEIKRKWSAECEQLDRSAEAAASRIERAKIAKQAAEAERLALVEQLQSLRANRCEQSDAAKPELKSVVNTAIAADDPPALDEATAASDSDDARSEEMRKAEDELRQQLWSETEQWMREEQEKEKAEKALADVHERALAAQREAARTAATRAQIVDAHLQSDVTTLLVDEDEDGQHREPEDQREQRRRARHHIERLQKMARAG